jgi:hypothetical protein
MTVKKWCYANLTPFKGTPNGVKMFDLPRGAVVEPTGQQQNAMVLGQDTIWTEIHYAGKDGFIQTGWINDAYLDDYIEQFPNPEVVIPNPTPETDDAPQYMLVEGKKKYNMCGELCIAFIAGEDIDSTLAKWKTQSPTFYNNILLGDRDKPTGPEDLKSILNAYGYSTDNGQMVSFSVGLTDPIIGFQPSQGRIQKMLETHFLIVLVTINSYGKLITKPEETQSKHGKNRPVVEKGIAHWIAVDKLTPNGVNAGRVEIYNPFPNKRQEYSFNEFIKSCNSSGWWVKRNIGG